MHIGKGEGYGKEMRGPKIPMRDLWKIGNSPLHTLINETVLEPAYNYFELQVMDYSYSKNQINTQAKHVSPAIDVPSVCSSQCLDAPVQFSTQEKRCLQMCFQRHRASISSTSAPNDKLIF